MEVLERAVYHEEKPPRIRRSPMKVLALGLSRSGTESLRNALSTLGYDHVYHGKFCFRRRAGDGHVGTPQNLFKVILMFVVHIASR